MLFAGQVIARTPFSVWLLLAYVLWQGVQALRPRTTSLARALVLPALFIVSGATPLVIGSRARFDLLWAWVLGAVLFAPVGFSTGPTILAVDRQRGCITRAGSALPLVRNLAVFVVQYVIAVAIALHDDVGGWLVVGGRAVSGATAGYFLGWAVVVCRRYFRAPAP